MDEEDNYLWQTRQHMPQELRQLIAINQNCTHLEVGFILIKAKCGSDCYDNIDLRNLETKKGGSDCARAVEVSAAAAATYKC